MLLLLLLLLLPRPARVPVCRRAGVEVLFLYSPVDDFVMTNLGRYNQRQLVSAEKQGLDLVAAKTTGDSDTAAEAEAESGPAAGEVGGVVYKRVDASVPAPAPPLPAIASACSPSRSEPLAKIGLELAYAV